MGIVRLLLALSVVLGHTEHRLLGFPLVDAVLAVELFFVISGFYMALVLDTSYRGPGSLKVFYINRALRIVPLYAVTAAATVALSLAGGVVLGSFGRLTEWLSFSSSLSWTTIAVFITANLGVIPLAFLPFTAIDRVNGSLVLTTQPLGSYPHPIDFTLVPHAWTLGLELLFYLLVPLLHKMSTRSLALLCAGSVACKLYLVAVCGLGYDPWFARFFPSECYLFCLGMLSYRLYKKRPEWLNRKPLALVVQIGMCAALLIWQFLGESMYLWHALILILALALPLLFWRSALSAFDRRLGELSYPVYLFHYLILAALRPWFIGGEYRWLYGEVVAVISIVCSLVALRYIQQPVDCLRARYLRHYHALISGAHRPDCRR